jgi:hypothetical protein
MSIRLLRLPLPVRDDMPALDAALPRLAWRSREARATWAARCEDLRDALLELELQQLARGHSLRLSAVECSALAVPMLAQRLAAHQIIALPVGAVVLDDAGDAEQAVRFRFALTTEAHFDAAIDALADPDPRVALRLANYPECCIDALLLALRADERTTLTSWAKRLSRLSTAEARALPWQANALLRDLGLSASPLRACSPACEAAHEETRLRWSAATPDLSKRLAPLRDLLDAGMDYDQRVGIAEVRTSSLRFVLRVDPSIEGLRARWRPAERVVVTMPQATTPLMSASATSIADEEPLDIDHPTARAHGFANAHAWRSRLACVAWEQSRAFRAGGRVLDLRAHDGYLLQLAQYETTRLEVFGIDADEDQITRARQRLPDRAHALVVAQPAPDLPTRLGLDQARFDIGLLRPEDLLTLDDHARAERLARVFALCERVIAYVSDDGLRRHGGLDAVIARAGLRVREGSNAADISAEVVLA